MLGVFVYLYACLSVPGGEVCWVDHFKSGQECGTVAGYQGFAANQLGLGYRYRCKTTVQYI